MAGPPQDRRVNCSILATIDRVREVCLVGLLGFVAPFLGSTAVAYWAALGC